MPITAASIRLLCAAILMSCVLLSGSLAMAGDGKVNLNTATIEQLEVLKGIGPELAQRIVAYRADHGPFKSVDDLTNVRGIGEGKLSRLRDHVTVDMADDMSQASPPNR